MSNSWTYTDKSGNKISFQSEAEYERFWRDRVLRSTGIADLLPTLFDTQVIINVVEGIYPDSNDDDSESKVYIGKQWLYRKLEGINIEMLEESIIIDFCFASLNRFDDLYVVKVGFFVYFGEDIPENYVPEITLDCTTNQDFPFVESPVYKISAYLELPNGRIIGDTEIL